MYPEPQPQHRSGCDQCSTARCCVRFEPELTAADLWRLTQRQGLAADAVAKLTPARADHAGQDAVFLFDDGLAWLMRLHSRDAAPAEPSAGGQRGDRPCRQLVEASVGKRRCGVYLNRPMRCRTFPTEWTSLGLIVETPEAICPPGAWSMVRSDVVGGRRLHLWAIMERDIYHLLLSQWQHRLRDLALEDRSARIMRLMAWLIRRWEPIALCFADLAASGAIDAVGLAWSHDVDMTTIIASATTLSAASHHREDSPLTAFLAALDEAMQG